MAGDEEMTAEELYAEVQKRIDAAVLALKTELLAAIAALEKKLPEEKPRTRILRTRG
jgi:hypothetical protein